MANITIELTSDYKKIYVKSDDASMDTNYPVMEIYINGETTPSYTLAVGGSQVIDSVTYTTTTSADNLTYATTTTTIGTEYIQIISTDTLGTTGSTLNTLTSGVWKFKLLDATATTNLFIGGIITEEIDCCMAEKLDDAFSTDGRVDDNKALEEVRTVWAILQSAKSSIQFSEFANGEYKYSIASTMCEDCGCI